MWDGFIISIRPQTGIAPLGPAGCEQATRWHLWRHPAPSAWCRPLCGHGRPCAGISHGGRCSRLRCSRLKGATAAVLFCTGCFFFFFFVVNENLIHSWDCSHYLGGGSGGPGPQKLWKVLDACQALQGFCALNIAVITTREQNKLR